jgi:hypothetical protein
LPVFSAAPAWHRAAKLGSCIMEMHPVVLNARGARQR